MRLLKVFILLAIFFNSPIFGDEVKMTASDVVEQYMFLKQQAEKGAVEDKYILFEFVDNNDSILGEFITSSFNMMLKAAISGHIPSQFKIGSMYMNGYRVEKNLPVALTWLIEAARNGNVEAELMCGINYAAQYMDQNSTKELNRLYKESDYWLSKAMKQGSASAKVIKAHLALIHYDTPPFPALNMLRESAEKNDVRAMYFLGDWYRLQWEKNGKNNDYEQAVFWLKKASVFGHVNAQYELNELNVDNDK
ncbi:tetratricopeptide repeat protein [Shewanella woodyi]|uniref:tetratricopeptide repeat protein n=1 Tax=Shewanella woodyi TaxID=60961 RepID=UPI0007EA2C85|nr:tetratricopeptide repeat protein [Shewanella woodyi]